MPMNMNTIPDIIIAIDGYSATGKSTLAKMVARQFGFTYLDSGAMYRAVTLFGIENGFVPKEGPIDEKGLKTALDKGLDIVFKEGNHAYIGSRCVEKEIRAMEISSKVSPVAALAFVRAFVDEKLHEAGRRGRVVMDGRDIGTAVFPDAQLKLFVTASPQVRAQRRWEELKAKGQETPMEDVLANLKERDYIDSHRETNPLRQADDAFVLDNSEMTLEEELVWIRGLITGHLKIYSGV